MAGEVCHAQVTINRLYLTHTSLTSKLCHAYKQIIVTFNFFFGIFVQQKFQKM